MSLSRPVKFPLLKLPFLCIEAVLKNSDIVDIIFFALLSQRARRIVKHLKIPLNRMTIYVTSFKFIILGEYNRKWEFRNESESVCKEQHHNLRKYPLVLQKNAVPVYTRRRDRHLESYSDEYEVTPLTMAMKFLSEVFKCSVESIDINDGFFPELGDIGCRSTVNLYIHQFPVDPFDDARKKNLNLLLENLEVTDLCYLWVATKEKVFSCDPKLFKCKKLVFRPDSTTWVTRETLLQFEVPQLKFHQCPLSEEDIVAFVNQWFHSDNRKFEYLFIRFQDRQTSLEKFQTGDLNSLPFSERNRVPLTEPFRDIDFSKGLEIVRHDGLQATIHVNELMKEFLFYIWHDQSAITQN